jgi:signal transduction histidine kinase/CheY-like chemotaxis protein
MRAEKYPARSAIDGDVIRLPDELCRTLASTTDLAGMLNAVVDVVARGLNAEVAQIWVQNVEANAMELRACAARTFEVVERPKPVTFDSFGVGRVARDRRSYVTNVVSDDPYLSLQSGVRPDSLVAYAGYPLLVDDRLLGVLSLYFCCPLPEEFVAEREWCANAVAIGIERKLANSSRCRHEADARQSHRLETLGRLVAGVAHDFNNLVTVVRGYSEIVMGAAATSPQLRKDTEEIHKAAQRAATLTRQLLGFARSQPVQRQSLAINAVVSDVSQMLRRLVREDIEFTNVLDPEAGNVSADATQLEQVLVNLILNARDAMPHGGRVSIQTCKLEVSVDRASTGSVSVGGACIRTRIADASIDSDSVDNRQELSPGEYVAITVSDTGCGIEPQHLPRIFEPFFSTKEPGRGTGVGLATVQDIVRQHGGTIRVASKPGNGTTFTIILPRAEESATSNYLLPQRTNTRPGTETILLVEDDEQLRVYVRDALRSDGYTVLEATDGDTATRLIDQHKDEIALLLADVVMPRVSGRELAGRCIRAAASSRVLLMSGHADSAVDGGDFLPRGVAFLQKPFGAHELLTCVRAVLDDTHNKPETVPTMNTPTIAA